MILSLLDAFDDVLVEPFMPDCAVVALDTGVLLRLAWLDVLDGDAQFLSPYQQLATNVFRAVVDRYGAGFAAPFDDPVQAANDPFGGNEKSTSMPSLSRLKSSSTFSSRNARPSPRRSAMKSMDQVMLGDSGTARASGLSRFSRLRGLIRRFSSSSQ